MMIMIIKTVPAGMILYFVIVVTMLCCVGSHVVHDIVFDVLNGTGHEKVRDGLCKHGRKPQSEPYVDTNSKGEDSGILREPSTSALLLLVQICTQEACLFKLPVWMSPLL
jgi:hypothetical protein